MYSLITINTWKCDGEYLNRLEVLKYEIKETRPDILLFQEAFQTVDNTFDTTEFIAKELGYSYVSSQSRPKKRRMNNILMDSFSNVSILSKFPIERKYIISLPSNPDDGSRDAIAAELIIEGKKMLVISIHLSHLRDGNELRTQQLLHILDQSFICNKYDAIFIGGDFNFPINKDYLENLSQVNYYLEDTFIFNSKPDIPQYTFTNGDFSRKLDHIVQVCKKGEVQAKVAGSEIVFYKDHPVYGIKASDHNGVKIIFNF